MMKNLKKGFTLIELLVVIAIIGILAAIVLASLGTARSKGNDAKIKEQLSSLRNAAEVYYSTNTHYGTNTVAAANCATGGMQADTSSGFNQIVAATAGLTCTTDSTTAASATKWSAYKALSDASIWCVDSTGASKSESSAWTAPTAGAACP